VGFSTEVFSAFFNMKNQTALDNIGWGEFVQFSDWLISGHEGNLFLYALFDRTPWAARELTTSYPYYPLEFWNWSGEQVSWFNGSNSGFKFHTLAWYDNQTQRLNYFSFLAGGGSRSFNIRCAAYGVAADTFGGTFRCGGDPGSITFGE
jgi:hypothetical protein